MEAYNLTTSNESSASESSEDNDIVASDSEDNDSAAEFLCIILIYKYLFSAIGFVKLRSVFWLVSLHPNSPKAFFLIL